MLSMLFIHKTMYWMFFEVGQDWSPRSCVHTGTRTYNACVRALRGDLVLTNMTTLTTTTSASLQMRQTSQYLQLTFWVDVLGSTVLEEERSSQIRRYSFDSLRIVLDTLGDDGDGSRADLWWDTGGERPIPMLAIAKLIDSSIAEWFETTPVRWKTFVFVNRRSIQSESVWSTRWLDIRYYRPSCIHDDRGRLLLLLISWSLSPNETVLTLVFVWKLISLPLQTYRFFSSRKAPYLFKEDV